MSTFTYIARRSLTRTHSVGKQYKLALPAKSIEEQVKTVGKQNKSQGGQTETIIHDRRIIRDFDSVWVSVLIEPAILEFLYSTDEGEVFQFDRVGKPNTPKNPINVKKEGLGFELKRLDTRYVSVSLKMIDQ